LFISPSAEVGSIGALAIHLDHSGQLAQDGVKATIIRSPAAKAEFNAFEPLAPEALAYEQAAIEKIHDQFVKTVARYRGVPVSTVLLNFGRGRLVDADHAVAHKMVDGMMTFAQVAGQMLDDLASPGGPSRLMMHPEERAQRDRQHDREARARQQAREIEMKAMRPGILRQISGYAILFDSPGWTGSTWEIVSPTAFDHVLESSAEVTFTRSHNYHSPLAKRSEFGVQLEKTERGIFATIDVPDTAEGRFLMRRINDREATGWSFSTREATDIYRFVEIGRRRFRLLERGDLHEVCVCLSPDQPTYRDTSSVLVGVA
jgi:HK97 family phage prohead protease